MTQIVDHFPYQVTIASEGCPVSLHNSIATTNQHQPTTLLQRPCLTRQHQNAFNNINKTSALQQPQIPNSNSLQVHDQGDRSRELT